MKQFLLHLFRQYRKELHSFFFGAVFSLILMSGMSHMTSFQANILNIFSISGTSNHTQKPYTENNFEETLSLFFDLINKNEVQNAYDMTSMDYQDRMSFLDFSNKFSSFHSITSLYITKQQNHGDHRYFVSFVATSERGDSLHPYHFLVDLMALQQGIKIVSISDEVYFQGRVMDIGKTADGRYWADVVNTGNVQWDESFSWQNSIDRASLSLTPELKGRKCVSPGEVGRFELQQAPKTGSGYMLLPHATTANFDVWITGNKPLQWQEDKK